MLTLLPYNMAGYICCSLCRYVYLLDSKGLVRWRGSGTPEQAELASLFASTEALLDQQQTNK
jgi:hypothetical protein